MAISTDPQDPSFGLETDNTNPNFGLPAQSAPTSQSGINTYGSQQSGEPQLSPNQSQSLTESIFGAASNAGEAGMDIVRGVPKMIESLPGTAYQGLKFATGGPQEQSQVIMKAAAEALPQGRQVAQDVQSPLGSRESFRGLFQLGMLAIPSLTETIFGRVKPEVPIEAEKPPVQEIETPPQAVKDEPQAPPARPEAPVVEPAAEQPVEAQPVSSRGQPSSALGQPKETVEQVADTGARPVPKIGDLVKFTEPSVAYRNGEPITVQNKRAGHISLLRPDGKIEVKAQDGSYRVFTPEELGYKGGEKSEEIQRQNREAVVSPTRSDAEGLQPSVSGEAGQVGDAGKRARADQNLAKAPERTVSSTTPALGGATTGARRVGKGWEPIIEQAKQEMRDAINKSDYPTPVDRADAIESARNKIQELQAQAHSGKSPDTGSSKPAVPVSTEGETPMALGNTKEVTPTAETPTTQSEVPPQGQAAPGELFAPAEVPFNLRGEEPPPEIGKEGAARAKAEAAYAQDKAQEQLFESDIPKEEQTRLQREHEQDLMSQYKEHMERGGEELLDAVKTSGKLPALSHPQVQQFSGELQNIREAYKAPREERIKYGDIFSKEAVNLDELTQSLKAKGFDVETPADTLALVEDRLRNGKPLYGSEALGQALSEQSFEYGMGAAASKEPLPGQTLTPGVRETGISQALHERRVGGQVETGEGVTAEAMVNRGRDLLQHGYDPEAIVDYVHQGGAVTGDEMAVLRAHVEELSKATNRAQDFADANPGNVQLQRDAETAFQNEAEWRQKVKPAASEWHRAGQAMQGETDIDTGTFTGLRRAFLDVKGRDATPGEQAKLTDLADKTQKAEAEVSSVKAQYDNVVSKETANLPPVDPGQLAFGEGFGAGVNPKAGITDLTRIIWKVAKDNYIDKGVTSLDDTIHGIALDTGLTSEVVREALTKPKAIRQITNELYAKMAARRNMVNAAKDYINAKDEPLWKKVAKAVWETPFSVAIYGHGTVGGETHAGANIYRPSTWKTYWPDFVNQAKFFARPGIHEAAMQTLVRDPNFITGKRGGLANDPNLTYTDYGAYAKFFGLQGGRRGFDALKTMRQSMFNAYWDKVPDSVKSDPAASREMARGYAEMVNHATGVISNSDRGFLATAARAGSPLAFAAKLEASRWARVIGDPLKTLDTYAQWNKATPAEKAVAVQRTKNAAEFAAMFVGTLYLNQAILSASGSKDKVNLTDPSKSDWLKHKIAGHTVAVDGGLLSPIRLLGRLTYDTLVRPRKELRGDTRTTAAIKDIGQYAVGKAAPSISIAKEAITAESFDGRLLPWSRDTSKKPRMTWTEYATSHGPIPLSGATKDIYDSMRERGMSTPDAKAVLRGLAAFGSELTGARVTEAPEERPVAEKPTRQKKEKTPTGEDTTPLN